MPAWLRALFARQKTAPNQREIGSDEAALWLLCAAISQKAPGVFNEAFVPGLSLAGRISAFRALARQHHPRWAPRDNAWARLAQGELNLEATFAQVRDYALSAESGSAVAEFDLATRTLPAFRHAQAKESLPLSEFFMEIDPVHLGPLLGDARAMAWAAFEREEIESEIQSASPSASFFAPEKDAAAAGFPAMALGPAEPLQSPRDAGLFPAQAMPLARAESGVPRLAQSSWARAAKSAALAAAVPSASSFAVPADAGELSVARASAAPLNASLDAAPAHAHRSFGARGPLPEAASATASRRGPVRL